MPWQKIAISCFFSSSLEASTTCGAFGVYIVIAFAMIFPSFEFLFFCVCEKERCCHSKITDAFFLWIQKENPSDKRVCSLTPSQSQK